MCKPVMTTLKTQSYGPCGFTVRSHGDACAAFTLGETWRTKLANVLRRWADKAERVRSLTVTAYGPSQVTFNDTMDAAVVGFNGANLYLNDLWRDRVFGSTDHEVAPIMPTKRIGA